MVGENEGIPIDDDDWAGSRVGEKDGASLSSRDTEAVGRLVSSSSSSSGASVGDAPFTDSHSQVR